MAAPTARVRGAGTSRNLLHLRDGSSLYRFDERVGERSPVDLRTSATHVGPVLLAWGADGRWLPCPPQS
jgi:hypothetical protein